MSKLSDKVYWLLNRKPGSRKLPYIGLAVVYAISGALMLIDVVLFIGAFFAKNVVDPTSIRIAFIILTCIIAFMILIAYQSDKQSGFIDALYRAYLQHRDDVRKRLGK